MGECQLKRLLITFLTISAFVLGSVTIPALPAAADDSTVQLTIEPRLSNNTAAREQQPE